MWLRTAVYAQLPSMRSAVVPPFTWHASTRQQGQTTLDRRHAVVVRHVPVLLIQLPSVGYVMSHMGLFCALRRSNTWDSPVTKL